MFSDCPGLTATDYAQLLQKSQIDVVLDHRFVEEEFGQPERMAVLEKMRKTAVRAFLCLCVFG